MNENEWDKLLGDIKETTKNQKQAEDGMIQLVNLLSLFYKECLTQGFSELAAIQLTMTYMTNMFGLAQIQASK